MTTAKVRWLIAVYQYLEAGRLPPSERAPDEKARGKIAFGPKPPTSTIILKCDLDQAIAKLPPVLESVVWAKIRWDSTGRAARHLRRRKQDVKQDLDAAIEMLAASMSPADSPCESPIDSPDRSGVVCMVSG